MVVVVVVVVVKTLQNMFGTYLSFNMSAGRYSNSLWARRSGYRNPATARFSAPVQTGPGAHPASYTTSAAPLPEVIWPVSDVDHPSHLASRLKKEYSYTSTPPLGLTACYRVNFRFTFSNVFVSHIEKNEMGGHVSCMGETLKVYTGFWWGNLRERDHSEDPDIDGRIIQGGSNMTGTITGLFTHK